MGKRRQLYTADNGEIQYEGTSMDIAKRIGTNLSTVYRVASDETRAVNGFYIKRMITSTHSYLAINDSPINPKTCAGTARYIHNMTGLPCDMIRRLARTGKTSRSGWQIEDLSKRKNHKIIKEFKQRREARKHESGIRQRSNLTDKSASV